MYVIPVVSTYDSVGILCFDLGDGVPTPAYAMSVCQYWHIRELLIVSCGTFILLPLHEFTYVRITSVVFKLSV